MESNRASPQKSGVSGADIETFRAMIAKSRAILFLGGAGTSTESGIPDFRSEDAVGRAIKEYGECPEEILSERFFYQHTETFFDYYRKNLMIEAGPNKAHYALSRLEQAGKLLSIVTQNIDTLHQKAGNRRVLQLHGSVEENRCVDCGRYFPASFVRDFPGVPRCPDCGHIVKPGVTLYGEDLDEYVLRAARARMFSADMLIVAGTSLNVYPAADLPQFFMGKRLVVINRTPLPLDGRADLVFTANVGDVLPLAVP